MAELSNGQTLLSADQKDAIRKARLFLNNATDWNFVDYLQFTIEPQLVSVDDPDLPEIAYHYMARGTGPSFRSAATWMRCWTDWD